MMETQGLKVRAKRMRRRTAEGELEEGQRVLTSTPESLSSLTFAPGSA